MTTHDNADYDKAAPRRTLDSDEMRIILARLLGFECEGISADLDWLHDEGRLPDRLQDVRRADDHARPSPVSYDQSHNPRCLLVKPHDGPCATHYPNAEVIAWKPWERGYGRCPFCTGLDGGDWLAICDCFMAERQSLIGHSDPDKPHG